MTQSKHSGMVAGLLEQKRLEFVEKGTSKTLRCVWRMVRAKQTGMLAYGTSVIEWFENGASETEWGVNKINQHCCESLMFSNKVPVIQIVG